MQSPVFMLFIQTSLSLQMTAMHLVEIDVNNHSDGC